MSLFKFLFILIPFLFTFCICNKDSLILSRNIIETNCTRIIGKPNEVYTDNVQNEAPLIYHYQLGKKDLKDPYAANIRIEAYSTQATSECPLHFAIIKDEDISTMEIPFIFPLNEHDPQSSKPYKYRRIGKNICLNYNSNINQLRNITIRVSTCSIRNVQFTLQLNIKYDFLMPLDREFTTNISPAEPQFFGYLFDPFDDVSIVRIKVFSEDEICATVSVQTFACPVFDQEINIRYKGLWQTMTKMSAMTLQNKARFKTGFMLVIIVHPDQRNCHKVSPFDDLPNDMNNFFDPKNSNSDTNKQFGNPRGKQIRILIENETNDSGFLFFLCLFIPFAFCLFIVLIVWISFNYRHRQIRKHAFEALNTKFFREMSFRKVNELMHDKWREGDNEINRLSNIQEEETNFNGENGEITQTDNLNAEEQNNPAILSPPPPPVEIYYVNNKKNRYKFRKIERPNICIGDFNQLSPFAVEKNSKRFYWTLLIVAVFYSIPVYQLILHYLKTLYMTGEYDLCYYNYLCSHRLGLIIDFNNFWSNSGYLIFGIAFIFIVRKRSRNICIVCDENKASIDAELIFKTEREEEVRTFFKFCQGHCSCFSFQKVLTRYKLGIRPQYGLFNALGLGLFMEGILSIAYHICPNQSNYQFDTCFMYVIAVLLILKIFQFRHPIGLGATATFIVLAVFVIMSVIGLILEYSNVTALNIFRRVFIAFQLLFVIILGLYYYSIGCVKDDDGNLVLSFNIFRRLYQLKKYKIQKKRLILPAMALLICVIVVIFSEMTSNDFATHLLFTLIANVLVFTIYYVAIMKPLHGEFKDRFWIQPTIYFASSIIFGGIAMYFFVQPLTAWEKSPSESREDNQECIKLFFPFLPFYDSHDIWHFFSAIGLFLSFMGLLTTDDDLIFIPQNEIAVF